MKYNIGDKVKIRKGLIAGKRYGENMYIDAMDKVAKDHDYVLTVEKHVWNNTQYRMSECEYLWTEEMIERLVGNIDRHKFEECIRKLSSLSSSDAVWNAFNYCVTHEPDEDGYEDKLKIISDFLFVKKKKMTKTEIEKELGYKIEIVEGE